MKDWKSLSHVRWECKYHIVFVSKADPQLRIRRSLALKTVKRKTSCHSASAVEVSESCEQLIANNSDAQSSDESRIMKKRTMQKLPSLTFVLLIARVQEIVGGVQGVDL